MKKIHRRAPDSEWVEMYRHGISARRIAEGAGAASSTVRYHLRLAAMAEPGLRDEHLASLNRGPRENKAGLTNLADLVSLFERDGRLPSSKARDPRERALAVWLLRRRQDMDRGTLNPVYAKGLEAVPGWEQRTRKSKEDAQWEERLAGVVESLAEGKDLPRHKNTDTERERLLGVWLHYQRTKLAAHQLDPGKEALLDDAVPGWREGRARGRKKS